MLYCGIHIARQSSCLGLDHAIMQFGSGEGWTRSGSASRPAGVVGAELLALEGWWHHKEVALFGGGGGGLLVIAQSGSGGTNSAVVW